MDWRLLLDYVRTLIWPTVTLALGVIFRKQLVKLAQRVDSVETPVGSVTFANQAEAIAQEATDVENEMVAEIQESTSRSGAEEAEESSRISAKLRRMTAGATQYNRRFSELSVMAELDPVGAVMGAWRELEVNASNAIRNRISGQVGVARSISESGILPEHLTRLTNDLMLLRNRVAHAGDVLLSVGDAKAYVAAAQTVADALELAQTPQARYLRYERALQGALLSLNLPVERRNIDRGCDFLVGDYDGVVGIIVKYRHRGPFERGSLEKERMRLKDSLMPVLIVTNAPLSDVVSQFNENHESDGSSIREVVQWRNQGDDDLLMRALVRAGVAH
ncbi:hypothetical protein ABZ817_16825 [Streptomyces antimycoticus]|uniref:hypothetical protein n=1 Tax=Streptomyces antimycoticus TaxID=68175 RepID=UPI0033C5851E